MAIWRGVAKKLCLCIIYIYDMPWSKKAHIQLLIKIFNLRYCMRAFIQICDIYYFIGMRAFVFRGAVCRSSTVTGYARLLGLTCSVPGLVQCMKNLDFIVLSKNLTNWLWLVVVSLPSESFISYVKLVFAKCFHLHTSSLWVHLGFCIN